MTSGPSVVSRTWSVTRSAPALRQSRTSTHTSLWSLDGNG